MPCQACECASSSCRPSTTSEPEEQGNNRVFGACGIDRLLQKLVDEKLSAVFHVQKENVELNLANGRIRLRKAVLRSELFEGLHAPVALKGGFIDDLSISIELSLWNLADGVVDVNIRDICLLFGRNLTDWTWENVRQCRSKLVDLIMQVAELPNEFKKEDRRTAHNSGCLSQTGCGDSYYTKLVEAATAATSDGGFLSGLQQKFFDNSIKKFNSMVKVYIHNVHFRYEDAVSENCAFTCGFKIGSISNTCVPPASVKVEVEQDEAVLQERSGGMVHETNGVQKKSAFRASGEWKHCTERHSDPYICQSIDVKRISCYWDVGVAAVNTMYPDAPLNATLQQHFAKLNRRELFSSSVVEHILAAFPSQHPRRKYLDGPRYRERFEYHRFLIFPFSVSLHLTINPDHTSTKLQLVPMVDVDVVCDSVDAAIDSEQIRCVNQLAAHISDFMLHDRLMRTRPSEAISTFLTPRTPYFGRLTLTNFLNNSDPIIAPEHETWRRKQVVRAWWFHAFVSVCIVCKLRTSSTKESRKETAQREALKPIYMEVYALGVQPNIPIMCSPTLQEAGLVSNGTNLNVLQEIEMKLCLVQIYDWRMSAKALYGVQRLAGRSESNEFVPPPLPRPPSHPSPSFSSREQNGDTAHHHINRAHSPKSDVKSVNTPGALVNTTHPDSLQVHLDIKSVTAHFLIDQSKFDSIMDSDIFSGLLPRKTGSTYTCRIPRELVLTAEIFDIRQCLVQKGFRGRRVGRWIEVGVRSVEIRNYAGTRAGGPSEVVFSAEAFDRHNAKPVCFFVGVNILSTVGELFEEGDAPVASLWDPRAGVRRHLETPISSGKAFLQGWTRENHKLLCANCRDDVAGILLVFAHFRVGRTIGGAYGPFLRRLWHLLCTGQSRSRSQIFLARHQPLRQVAWHHVLHEKLNGEVLPWVQSIPEELIGKRIIAIAEGFVDDSCIRLFEGYNLTKVVCSEMSFAPLRLRVLRNRDRTLQSQYFQLATPGGIEQEAWGCSEERQLENVLPTKVSAHFLQKKDFMISGMTSPQPLLLQADTQLDNLCTASKKTTRVGRSMLLKPKNEGSRVANAEEIKKGGEFTKWGRSGKPLKRWVYYEVATHCIIWTLGKGEKIKGYLPLIDVQDILVGAQTPVLECVRSKALRPDLVISLVTSKRTLDLQAASEAVHKKWVTALKSECEALYRSGTHSVISAREMYYGKVKERVYPRRYRSNKCAMMRSQNDHAANNSSTSISEQGTISSSLERIRVSLGQVVRISSEFEARRVSESGV